MRASTKVILITAYIFIYLPNIYSQTLTAAQIYKKVSGAVVVILAYNYNDELASQGSGVIINDEGYVVTNYHILAGNERVEVIHNKEIIPYSDIIGIDVERDIESEIYVSCDRYRLKQSFWNLFLNSMQSISGDGLIKVEAFSERQSVIIKISDSGCGISQKNISNIFDPFFTTKNSGTGLGLVIVQKVIESYNGKIDVVSAVDEGTTFIITMEKVSINAI